MSEQTRDAIRGVAEQLGYIANAAARGTRKGYMPIVAVLADDIITTPFATEIIRGLDIATRKHDMTVFVTNRGADRSISDILAEIKQFRPKTIGYAAMYHKSVRLPPQAAGSIRLMINCTDADNRVPAIVPDNELAAYTITAHLIAAGRRRIAFLNLPVLVAGKLREKGFRRAVAEAGLPPDAIWVRPAAKGHYRDVSQSLVREHLDELMRLGSPPDAILAGNDRVALEIYGALRRLGARIPDDIAVASFDNHVDIAARLDPPLTTMALPHREMGLLAGHMLLSERPMEGLSRLPFTLVERASVG